MFTFSLNVFKYRTTYFAMVIAIIVMNILAHAQSNLLNVTRPLSGYILPTLIGGLIGFFLSSTRVTLLEKNENQKRIFITIVQSLSIALDERDAYTYGHSSRVTEYALALGRKLGLSKTDLEILEMGSILHDIGKIGIADTILNKPVALDEEELEVVKQHTIKGERIIGPNDDPKIKHIVACIRSHHEKYDGSGYPDGLKGNKIPLMARIISIADAFDAMTTLRPYKPRATPENALKEIALNAGGQFDPLLAYTFSEIMIAGDFQLMHSDKELCRLQNITEKIFQNACH